MSSLCGTMLAARHLPSAPMTRGVAIVLLLTDDIDRAALVAHVAHRHRFHSVHAPWIADALTKLRAHAFDMAVVDMDMRDGSALRAIARVRAQHPHLAIMAVTTSRSADTFMSALGAGASECSSSPRKPTELAVRMRAALDWCASRKRRVTK